MTSLFMGLPGGSVVKNPPANAEDTSALCSVPASGRYPGGGNSTDTVAMPYAADLILACVSV